MYQMALFFKKSNCLNNTHQKISDCNIFLKFSWGSLPPNLPNKEHGFTIMWLYRCAAYCFDTCKFTFQKKNLDPLSNSVYSSGIHVQIN